MDNVEVARRDAHCPSLSLTQKCSRSATHSADCDMGSLTSSSRTV